MSANPAITLGLPSGGPRALWFGWFFHKSDRPTLWWLLVGVVLALPTTIFAWRLADPEPFLCTAIPMIVGIVLMPLASRRCYLAFAGWQETTPCFVRATKAELDEWLGTVTDELLRYAIMNTVGGLLALLSLLSFGKAQGWSLAPHTVWLALLVATASYFAGVALCHMFVLTTAIRGLGRFKVRVENHAIGTAGVGALLINCWRWALGIWAVITCSALSRHGVAAGPLGFIAAPALVGLVFMFLASQLPLHRRMVEYKREKLRELHERAAIHLDQTVDQLDDDGIKQLALLDQLIARVSALPEWPLGGKGLLGMSSLSLVGLLPHLKGLVANDKVAATLKAAWHQLVQ